MLNTIAYQVVDYRFNAETSRWMVSLCEIAHNEPFELPVSFVVNSENVLKSLSVQHLKIIYFLHALEQLKLDPTFADNMLDILFWRKFREDDLELTQDRNSWPITALHSKPLCQIIAQDYSPGKSFCEVTFQYFEHENIVKVAAKYVIGDDDFVARLPLADIERLVSIVVSEQTNAQFTLKITE